MKNQTAVLCLIAMSILVLNQSSGAQSLENFIDKKGLEKSGEKWTVYRNVTGKNDGHIRLHHSMWLMYFLHWRPLTEDNRNITPEYVKNRMLNFWGPNMSYFKTGKYEGTMEVNGHPARYIDGTFAEFVKTRFIIWNCEETGRQFIADLNINLRRGTPDALHDIQQYSAVNIVCHDAQEGREVPLLPKIYYSKKYDLTFAIPNNWRTFEFLYPKWFPNGLTKTNGTLLSLLTDSEKRIEFCWKKGALPLTEETLRQFFAELSAVPAAKADSSRMSDFTVANKRTDDGCLIVDGKFQMGTFQNAYKNLKEEYLYRAFLKHSGNKTVLILAGMIHQQEVWGLKMDLMPSKRIFNRFINKEVLPNLKL